MFKMRIDLMLDILLKQLAGHWEERDGPIVGGGMCDHHLCGVALLMHISRIQETQQMRVRS